MVSLRWICPFALGLTALVAACAHRKTIHSTTQLSPTTLPAGQIPQPPLRRILRDLSARGAADAAHATVFVLSHWILDKGLAEDQKRIFEGAPFQYDGAKVFLTVGPMDVLKKDFAPPAKDMIVRTEDKDSRGFSMVLAGQRWQAGFSMKGGDQQRGNELERLLMEVLNTHRTR